MPEQKVTFAATAKVTSFIDCFGITLIFRQALRLIRKPRMQLHDPSVPAATIPLTTTTPTTSSSMLLELLAISPPIHGSPSATKTPHITKQQSFTELNQPSSVTKQRLSASPTSIPRSPTEARTSDKEVITLSRSPSPTSNSPTTPVSPKLPTPEIKAEAKIPPLPQFRVVSREHPEEADVKKAPGKHLWLDTREKGELTQPERPPIIAFSPEKLPPTLQGRSSLITQALLTERKSQQGPLPAIQAKQGDSQDKMPGTNTEREVSSKVAFHPRPQSQFELPAGIPKMPGLIDLKLMKARAESKVWIPPRPVETLASKIMEMEKEAEARSKQQSSLEHINLKALLQQPASGLQTDRSESGSQVQKKETGSLQSLHQLALRLTPHKTPTASDERQTHTTEPRGRASETGQSFKSALQRANSFSSSMRVAPEDHFRNRMMTVPEEKKRKLSLSSGLSSSMSYDDEDEEDRPLVIDTEESGQKAENDKRMKLQLGKNPTPVPAFQLTPLQEVKNEPWSFEGYNFDREQDASYLTPMEDDDLDDLDSLDRMVGPSQSNQKRGNDPKQPEKVECPYCKRFYGKYYINKHMVDQHP